MIKSKHILSITVLLSVFLVFSCANSKKETAPKIKPELTQYVDPYIGTGSHGHVFLGANVPYGAVQLGPTNLTEGWDWCSGYNYSDSTLIGFAHTHLSGTGIGDLGDILLMPVTGKYKMALGSPAHPEDGYLAFYKHRDEQVKPGYYSVNIARYHVKAELTASERTGFHRYTFSEGDDAHILLNLVRGIGWDAPVEGFAKLENDTLLTGYRFSKGWAKDQKIYFAAVFSKPVKSITLFDDDRPQSGTELKAVKLKADLDFGQLSDRKIEVKVGISPVSSKNALANMKAEIPAWNFDQVVAEANAKWNHELGKVRAKSSEPDILKIFYTALYHTMIAPSIFQDVNGEYRGSDGKIYRDTTFVNYTTLSLWDTYRAAQPLYTLLHPGRVNDLVNTMLKIYEQQGKLPVWPLMGNETNCMVGYSAVPVIADAYFKGFKGFDANLAYEAMKTTSMRDDGGLKYLKAKGYIPADKVKESVSKGLEYAISDWCIAQMAKSLGKEADYKYYIKRSKDYREYFDPKTGFMRGRLSNGKFRTPFDPVKSGGDFTEGNSWQYTFLVPQDVKGLIKLLGGDKAFCKKLDGLFTVKQDLGKHVPDISGLIGMYAQGNEPSHHIAYLYAFAGEPWKTAERVRYIMNKFYTARPDGLVGNEDVGQMSAWYVLSAMGFYQVNPADGRFIFGSPMLDEATIQLPKGKTFTIKAINNSKQNIYIKRKILNGETYTKNYITYKDIMAGGKLVLEMTSQK